jgi:two-component system OmpR family sensor kinase
LKWLNSIITKITIIFLLALVGIIAMLFIFVRHQMQEETLNWENFARHAIHSAFDRSSRTIDFESLEALGLKQVFDEDLKKHIFESYRKKEFPQDKPRGMMRLGIQAIPYKRSVYIILHSKENTPLLFSTDYKKELFPSLVFPFVAILFVLFLYIAIIRSLLPLNDLKSKIKKFSDGDYSVTCESKSKDEIGALANEFHNAVKKIRKLRDSRQLFLRNIMHELKTPITKGKFISELIEDKQYQASLANIFTRQENLIEEFSRIEKLSADELKLDIKEYNLADVLDFALDILNHESDCIDLKTTPCKINVDFELFATALKNLLDNAINYSPNKKVSFQNTCEVISIENYGDALEFELEKYSEPYFLDGTKQKSSRGLGFGLFITWHIIRLHNMKIEYFRENGKNIFKIYLIEKNS